MNSIIVYDSPDKIPRDVVEECLLLTRKGSEKQGQFKSLLAGKPIGLPFMLAVGSMDDEVVGWASCDIWQFMWQAQAFVQSDLRWRGIGTALMSWLLADHPERDKPLAVFDITCYRIAKSAGWRDVRLYELDDGVWVPVKMGNLTDS